MPLGKVVFKYLKNVIKKLPGSGAKIKSRERKNIQDKLSLATGNKLVATK